jgi:DNA-binding NarL/FixJ family response regulator
MKQAIPISVLVVDDHQVVRVGLRTLLGGYADLRVVGEAGSVATALSEAARLQPRVVLLDLRLREGSGLDVCRQLKESANAPAVLFLTSYGDNASVVAAITAGADGYILKDVEGTDIPNAIRTVAAGGTVLDPLAAGQLAASVRSPVKPTSGRAKLERLSGQERRVLSLVVEGKSNKETAELLALGEGTVKNYLANVFAKLEVRNRAEAVGLWLRYQGPHES